MKKILLVLIIALGCNVNLKATVYYLKAGGNMTTLADWGTATNGTGTAPASFIGGHTWNVHNNANLTLNTTFAVSSNAIVNIGDGTNPITFNYTGGVAKMGLTTPPTINFNANSVFVLDQYFSGYSTNKTNFLANSTYSCGAGSDQVPADNYYNLVIGQIVYTAGSATVQGVLTINPGMILDIDVSPFTISGSIANTTGEFLGNNYGSNLILTGTGNMGTLRFVPGTEMLSSLTLNMANSSSFINLSSNLLIDDAAAGSLNLTQGGIKLNGFNLGTSSLTTLSGGSALVYGDPNSVIDIQSSSVSGNLTMDATSNSLKALILNSSGTLGLGTALNILDSVKVSGGTLSSGGFLTLKSTASLKARIANCTGGNISGSVNVETFALGGTTDWSVLGVSGVSGQTMNSWYGQIPMAIEGSATGVTSVGGEYWESVQGWNENDAYGYDTTITVATALTPGKGFWVYLGDGLGSTGDMIWSVTGSPVMGNVNYPVSSGGAQTGFNLVSNPYASPISWAKVLAASPGMFDAVYIYNPDAGQTQYVNGVASHPSTSGAADVIPMGQGFYVQSNGAASLNFTESCKVANNTNSNPLLRSANSVDPNIGAVMHLKVEGGGYSDYAAIRFHSGATTSFDGQFDAHKIYDSPGYVGYPGIWTKRTVIATQTEGVDYGINSLPYAYTQNAVIPVIVRVYSTGQYTISSSDFSNLQANGNTCIILKDKLTNVSHDLTAGDYVCNISDTTYAPRFELTVCANGNVPAGIKTNSAPLSNSVFISKDSKGIFTNLNFNKPTNATISVTNVLGQKIMDSKKVKVTNETVYLDVNTTEQLIFVTVETENEKVTKKFLNFN